MITWDNFGTIVAVGLIVWGVVAFALAIVVGKSIKQADDIEARPQEETSAKG